MTTLLIGVLGLFCVAFTVLALCLMVRALGDSHIDVGLGIAAAIIICFIAFCVVCTTIFYLGRGIEVVHKIGSEAPVVQTEKPK